MFKENITWKALRRHAACNRAYFPLEFLLTLFRRFSPYFNLWMSAEIVTALYENAAASRIRTLELVTLAGNLTVRIAGAILEYALEIQVKKLETNEKLSFNEKTFSLDYDKLEDPRIRTLRRKIVENSYIKDNGIRRMRHDIVDLFSHVINLMFAFAMFAEMAISIARAGISPLPGVCFAALLTVMTASVAYSRFVSRKSMDMAEEITDYMLRENQIGSGFRVIALDTRIYRQYERISQIWKQVNDAHRRLYSRRHQKEFWLRVPSQLLTGLSTLLAYLIVLYYCAGGVFPVGGMIKYVGFLNNVTESVVELFACVFSMRENERFLKLYLDYFEIPNDMYQGSLSVEKRSDRRYDMVFQNVGFRYAGADTWALKHIDLTIRAGERLAVVGRNGSGKTTFVKLLCRLYDPTEGEIRLNDFNVRKYDYRQYLDLFSIVFQDYKLLSLPLGNNVAVSETVDGPKAERLLEEAGFGQRLRELPRGLDTPLYKHFDKEGVEISGGEAQKIALARALYRDAAYIILDEPTAALDPIAEAEIYAKFDEIASGRTAIYISHRLSSCRFCDRIAVFDEGRLVQLGAHEELLADTGGTYYALWTAQAQYYET